MELSDTYSTWKRTREELDMYEQDPRCWLRKHGQYRGLAMTHKDQALEFAEILGLPLALSTLYCACLFYAALRRR